MMNAKSLYITAIAAALFTLPAAAKDAPPVTISDWMQAVETKVDKALADSIALNVEDHREGLAKVRFALDADGRPADVRIAESSGNASLDAEAINVTKRLGALPALPGRYANAKSVVLQIKFATPSGTEKWNQLAAAKEQVLAMRAEALQSSVMTAAGGYAPADTE